MNESLIYRLRKRAEIRRQISTRKSVQEGKPDRISDLLEDAAKKLEEYEMGCKNCEKLKDALVSLVQESDVKNLDYMRQYLESVLEQSGKNDDIERSLFAINTLIEYLNEDQ